MKRRILLVVLALALLLMGLAGCEFPIPFPSEAEIHRYPIERALGVLLAGHPEGMAIAQALGVPTPNRVLPLPLPQLPDSLRLIKIPEARAIGARATGMVAVLFDKFESYPDHGDLVAAVMFAVAPELELYYCDIFKESEMKCARTLETKLKTGELKVNGLNNSWGYVGTGLCHEKDRDIDTQPFSSFGEYLKKFIQNWQIFVVASAGNEGQHNCTIYPAAYKGVLSAGAVYDTHFDVAKFRLCTDYNVNADDITCWSNWGEVFAPGWRQDIRIGDETKIFGGTSAASPFTLATLLTMVATCYPQGVGKAPGIVEKIERDFSAAADPIPPRFDYDFLPHRRINAYNAVVSCMGAPPPPPHLYDWVDANNNCIIDDDEILRAVQYWIERKPWDGGPITDAEILDLVRLWILGTSVC